MIKLKVIKNARKIKSVRFLFIKPNKYILGEYYSCLNDSTGSSFAAFDDG